MKGMTTLNDITAVRGKTSAASTAGSFAPKNQSTPELALAASVNDVLTEAVENAEGSWDTPTISRVGPEGKPLPGGALCEDCAEDKAVTSIEETLGGERWAVSTGDIMARCAYCHRGVGSRGQAIVDEYTSALGDSDIAGYTYKAEHMRPEKVIEELIAEGAITEADRDRSVEEILSDLAAARGVDRDDEWSFDTDDFPKVILAGQLTADDADWIGE